MQQLRQDFPAPIPVVVNGSVVEIQDHSPFTPGQRLLITGRINSLMLKVQGGKAIPMDRVDLPTPDQVNPEHHKLLQELAEDRIKQIRWLRKPTRKTASVPGKIGKTRR